MNSSIPMIRVSRWISIAMLMTCSTLVLSEFAWNVAAINAGELKSADGSAGTSEADRAQPFAPLSDRFADGSTEEIPDFQKHITPLLGRLGCNGRACHGSFQGRGGFALSLFGYDFQADHSALMEESSGRVDVDDPDESLILSKPLDADSHEGGKRFDEGSWQHHVLRRWIESGATLDAGKPKALDALDVYPSEIIFANSDGTAQLKVIAKWQDGTREDVTELCRFQTNDDSIAIIDEDGQVAAGMYGDTHVVVFYDNSVVPIPVLRPRSDHGSATAYVDSTSINSSDHMIDKLVDQKLRKLAIVPSGTCSDADFIRRASLDVCGTLPTTQRVREFLNDSSPDKRERLIDELLDSPAYAAWWATRLSDWTGNSEPQMRNLLPIPEVASKLWYEWLRKRVADNMPYDKIVEGIVMASSREPGEDYETYCANMSDACREGGEKQFAQRSSMPLYWGRQNFQKNEDRAIGFGYSFLGVRIECAQCHKHPFDSWSKQDFDQFAKLFSPIRMNRGAVAPDSLAARNKMLQKLSGSDSLEKKKIGMLLQGAGKLIKQGEVAPFGELVVNERKPIRANVDNDPKSNTNNKKSKKQAKKRPQRRVPSGIILGEEVGITLDKDPREELMQWLRAEDNPYFAKAIVNRVWANYFGIGIVNPVDDLNLANPPSNADLLNELAEQFIEQDFDLKWLHRTITTSQTYARSSEPNETNSSDQSNFSRHIPHRLPAEVLADCVTLATASDSVGTQFRSELKSLAIANGKAQGRNRRDYAMQVFGQSTRASNCDCDRSDSPSLLQSVYLRNDIDIHRGISATDGWVNQACRDLGEAGPTAIAMNNVSTKVTQGEKSRVRMIEIAKRYATLDKPANQSARKQMRRTYDKIAKRMMSFNFAAPKLDELAKDPESWTMLTTIAGTPVGPNSLDATDEREKANESAKVMSLDDIVDDAYLRSLSRFPDEEERQISIAFIEESDSLASGLSSLIWALVNTKEFVLTH
ncbi:DUF1549 and DUF1553 domain-containing protein [Rubripirellula amarantea]|nr:DUF1549 and DUF1553 domain-containing protein [Rubripirellula amarantea]